SADGRYVTFESYATDLVSGFIDNNGPTRTDVFRFDRLAGTVTLVSHASGSLVSGSNNTNYGSMISRNGSFIAFTSRATNLLSGFVDSNGPLNADVFVYDNVAATVALASHSPTSALKGASGNCLVNDINNDGHYVLFFGGSDLINGSKLAGQIYLYDRTSNTNTLVSHVVGSATTGIGGSGAFFSAMSVDGNFVAFYSTDTSVVNAYSGTGYQLYLYDRASNSNSLVSHIPGDLDVGADGASNAAAI